LLDVGLRIQDGKDGWAEKRQAGPKFSKTHQCARVE